MANTSQLRTLYVTHEKALKSNQKVPFYEAIMAFLILSIILQILIGIILIILSKL